MPVYSVWGNLQNYCTSKADQEKNKDIIPEAINLEKHNIAYPDLPLTRPVKVISKKANQMEVKNFVEGGRKVSVKHTTYSKEERLEADQRGHID